MIEQYVSLALAILSALFVGSFVIGPVLIGAFVEQYTKSTRKGWIAVAIAAVVSFLLFPIGVDWWIDLTYPLQH